MTVIKSKCRECENESISSSFGDYGSEKPKVIFKACAKYADPEKGPKKIFVKKRCLGKYEGVKIENIAFLVKEKEGDTHNIYSFGGSNYGAWNGTDFSEKRLFFVNRELTFPAIADIRVIQKLYQHEGNNIKKSTKYITIEPADITSPLWYLYLTNGSRKPSLAVVSRRIYYEEHLVPVEGNEANIVELASTPLGIRNGYYGNLRILYLADRPCRVEENPFLY